MRIVTICDTTRNATPTITEHTYRSRIASSYKVPVSLRHDTSHTTMSALEQDIAFTISFVELVEENQTFIELLFEKLFQDGFKGRCMQKISEKLKYPVKKKYTSFYFHFLLFYLILYVFFKPTHKNQMYLLVLYLCKF